MLSGVSADVICFLFVYIYIYLYQIASWMFKSHGLHDLRIWFRKRSSPPLPPPRITGFDHQFLFFGAFPISQHFGASLKTKNRLFPSARWVCLNHAYTTCRGSPILTVMGHHFFQFQQISWPLQMSQNHLSYGSIAESLDKHVWTKIRRSSSIIQFQINITTGASSQRFRITGSQGEAFYRRLGYIPPDLVSIQGSRS